MAEERADEIRVHCGECGHEWVAAYLPMELGRAVALMKAARCPRGCVAKVYWGGAKPAD